MKIAVGNDHAGLQLKNKVVEWLGGHGFDIVDVGTDNSDSTDYPDYAEKVGELVNQGKADLGILVCYSGAGMCIAANKIRGIRAAHPATLDEAFLMRSHNDANVLCLGQGTTDTHFALELTEKFLETTFSGEERHIRRVEKIAEMEKCP